jgi:hypothetical protein
MTKPLPEYLADRQGLTWQAEDTEHVLHVLKEVERTYQAIIEKREAERKAS